MGYQPTLLIQLPIPQLNFSRQTGNIPLGAACLKMAADSAGAGPVELVPQRVATYLGDAALLRLILSRRPAIVGFTVYTWNVDRSLYLSRQLKSAYGPKIIFGGPEVTPDNSRVHAPEVDFRVYGDGEACFVALLTDANGWAEGGCRADADAFFQMGRNPYAAGLLEPEIENMVLVETQRGCPHRCGYCHYGKSRRRIAMVPWSPVIDAIAHARQQALKEVYLLDPCLNARQDLDFLLDQIRVVNDGHPLNLISEIRAEGVDAVMANRFAAAGFTWFEIGLQSTNPTALRIMQRPTDLGAFLNGVGHLKTHGITAGIDLIAGLPGDDPPGFIRSVDFVLKNGMTEDVQVFPLSVLPGTPFRRRSRELGLVFDPDPPYTVIQTPTFSRQQLSDALDEAQKRFDLSLYPFPDLDLSGCIHGNLDRSGHATRTADLSGIHAITGVFINREVESNDLENWASRLAHPYQLFFNGSAARPRFVAKVIRRLTTANPFTPVEVILVEPDVVPAIGNLLAASRLARPHYLDKDLNFLYPRPGNRAILFTLLSRDPHLRFQGDMQRQVLWWTADHLPDRSMLATLFDFDGIFIPEVFNGNRLSVWQTRMAPHCQDLPDITFADSVAQKRWIGLTAIDDYWLNLPQGPSG